MMIKPKNLPSTPGVYKFHDESGEIIYVGKAKNLKNRVESYFSTNLGVKTGQMVATATSLDLIKVDSEFEALLLEANLVRKYQPKYNIELKDDKSPLYIGITKEDLPRIVTFRKKDVPQLKLKYAFGPFLTGLSARKILRIVRRIFHYSTHVPSKRICIYKQIGLCDPCPSEVNTPDIRKKYLRNVRGVKNILSGKLDVVRKELEHDMHEYAKREMFEEAALVAQQITLLQDATTKRYEIEEYLENPNFIEDIREKELQELRKILVPYFDLQKLQRIECFDIAHLGGSFPTASMVTFVDGESEKKYYRHFKIYGKKKQSDTDSMREVITRRIKHFDDYSTTLRAGWGRPDLIIIDGGKPQLSAVGELLEKEKIPYIGLAKRFETIVVKTNDVFVEIKATGEALKLLQRMRDEAHRFARRLHHKYVRDSIKI